MPRKGKVFENQNSKKKVTIQLRGYNSEGKYEGKSEDDPNSIEIRHTTEAEVLEVIEKALREKFGAPTE